MHAMEYYSAIKKEITSFAATWAKAFDCVDHNKLWKKFFKRWEYRTI